MKVLHLPYNIASQISVTVRALRDIGIDARGLVTNNALIQNARDVEILPTIKESRYSIRGILHRIPVWRSVLSAIKWADVVHWHFTNALWWSCDLRYAKRLGKARIVEFWGSDIRIPEIASADNPYMARMYDENPRMALGAAERSRCVQARFSRYGFECLNPGFELKSYIQEDIFPSPYRSRARLILSDFQPRYPDPHKRRPLIVHAPSSKVIKGTDAVLRAIEELKSKYEFDFQLIHGFEHCESLEIVQNCDIMLDQFVIGAHGLLSLEAMAFGKPVVCYIKPSLVSKYPDDLPIVNANQENLAGVVKNLLEDGRRRHEIGRRSRAYVEKYHDAHKIARELVAIYEELLGKVRRKPYGHG